MNVRCNKRGHGYIHSSHWLMSNIFLSITPAGVTFALRECSSSDPHKTATDSFCSSEDRRIIVLSQDKRDICDKESIMICLVYLITNAYDPFHNTEFIKNNIVSSIAHVQVPLWVADSSMKCIWYKTFIHTPNIATRKWDVHVPKTNIDKYRFMLCYASKFNKCRQHWQIQVFHKDHLFDKFICRCDSTCDHCVHIYHSFYNHIMSAFKHG